MLLGKATLHIQVKLPSIFQENQINEFLGMAENQNKNVVYNR